MFDSEGGQGMTMVFCVRNLFPKDDAGLQMREPLAGALTLTLQGQKQAGDKRECREK